MMDKYYQIRTVKLNNKEINLIRCRILTDKNWQTYEVIEPVLDSKSERILTSIKNQIKIPKDINDFSEFIKRINLDKKLKKFDYILSEIEDIFVKYFIFRDMVGTGRIEPLILDDNISYIMCLGMGKPLFVFHENFKNPIQTNIVFKSRNELEQITKNLCKRMDFFKSASPNKVGTLSGFHVNINTHNLAFSINKQVKKEISGKSLVSSKLLTEKQLSYLAENIKKGKSILIAGPKNVDKSFLLNRLLILSGKNKKILSLEKNPMICLREHIWISKTLYENAEGLLKDELDILAANDAENELNMLNKHKKQKIIAINYDKTLKSLFKDLKFPKTAINRFDIVIDLGNKRPIGNIEAITEIQGYDFYRQKLKIKTIL